MSATQSTIFTWAGASHSGSRKPQNDDSFVVFSSGIDGAEKKQWVGQDSVTTRDLVFAVSDGMGGGKAGDLASALLLEKMTVLIPQTFRASASGFFPDSLSHLERTIKEVHTKINEAGAANEDTQGMAATLALAWFTPDNLYIANVGDSRIYLHRDGVLKQISKDHNAAWSQWKRGEIKEIQYRSHSRRPALYEVIGGGAQYVHPHLAAIPYQADDCFLICSDGLIDGLWERQISNTLSEQKNPIDACNSLLIRAVENSGIDDTTLLVIRIGEAD